jgi:hypothetical protein
MKVKALYDMLFTEYSGHLGFAPAVVTIALGLVVGGAVVYGGITLGKAAFAHTPAVETGHS